MKKSEVLNKYNISDATLRNWIKLGYIIDKDNIDEKEICKIIANKKDVRRNKKNSLNHTIPTSYVKDKRIVRIIEKIIEIQERYNVESNEVLRVVIGILLKEKKMPSEVGKVLGNNHNNPYFESEIKKLNILYNEEEDFLGCLYMSLLSEGKKDCNGIFYTPFSVVEKIINSIDVYEGIRILDPGCGSGNFLIQMYKKMIENGFTSNEIINALYGFDIDEVAILIAKINLYNLSDNIEYNDLNIKKLDFINSNLNVKFDVIIGNPPWGIKYTKKEKEDIKEKYGVDFSKQDSFSQFIIRSFEILNKGGCLGFVLPTSILNIASHKYIRKFILDQKIIYIKNIGREFGEVVTDAIIIKIEKTHDEDNMCIYNRRKISQSSFRENPYFNFLIPSIIPSNIISKIKKYKSIHLNEDNSQFSLGIVTGNNKAYIHDKKIKNSEPIISGKEVTRYNFDYSLINKYIIFDKDKLQQVAPVDNYRKEKIIYKFIGNKLCFAIENKGLLTLNSANIINISSIDIYYVSAILNSRVTQLFFDEIYKTHKVLKNHIQSFYIFEFDDRTKKRIIELSRISCGKEYNEELENIIYDKLNLTDEEIEYLKELY